MIFFKKLLLCCYLIVGLTLIEKNAFCSPVILNMDKHPQDQGWLVNSCYYGSSNSSLSEGILKIETDSCYSFQPRLETTQYNDTGWIVKTRMRVVDTQIITYNDSDLNSSQVTNKNDIVAAFIDVSDNIRSVKLLFYENKVKINGYYQEVALDTSKFHEFKLVGNFNGIRLYIDGALEIDWRDVTPNNQSQLYINMSYLAFGINNENYTYYDQGKVYPGLLSVTEWDYFEYDPSAVATDEPTEDDRKYVQYMPEGYIEEGVSEFVGVLNSSAQAAEGELIIYYSDGTNDSFSVYFPPYQRSTVDIKMLGVRQQIPFSTVIKTDRRITATLIHYDQGKALGENFTNVKSTRWGIAEGFVSENTCDYLSILNPNDYMVEVKLTMHPNPWNQGVITLRVAQKSRAKLTINDFIKEELYPFAYGITMESTGPIVASMSRYDFVFGDGMLFMATPNMGETSGYVAEGVRTDESDEFLDFLNINSFGINLELTIHYIDGISHTTKQYIGYNQWASIKLTENIVTRENIPYAIEYEATNANYWYEEQKAPLLANFIHAYSGHMEGIRFQQDAHRYWEFAEGFRDASKKAVLENLNIFNPSDYVSTGNITIYYDDGIKPTVLPFKIASHGKASFALHEIKEIREAHSWGAISYGIKINSDIAVIPHFTHQDKNIGGSFALNGTGWD